MRARAFADVAPVAATAPKSFFLFRGVDPVLSYGDSIGIVRNIYTNIESCSMSGSTVKNNMRNEKKNEQTTFKL